MQRHPGYYLPSPLLEEKIKSDQRWLLGRVPAIELAAELHCSENTVNRYRRKLGIPSYKSHYSKIRKEARLLRLLYTAPWLKTSRLAHLAGFSFARTKELLDDWGIYDK